MQYHNADNRNSYPKGLDINTTVDSINLETTVKTDNWIDVGKKTGIHAAIGSLCFLLVGKKTGAKKKFYLWSFFKIEGTTPSEDDDTRYDVFGTGCNFPNPILLNEIENFEDFKKSCANFVRFKNITHVPFTQNLINFSSNL
jgi:hypothetical protein